MLAASQKIPVKCFATGLQQHPYTFFSLEKKPIRTPKDMVGKKIGIQATGKILLSALLKKHNIPEKDVEVVVIGSDFAPLLTGQTDAVTGWLTSTTAIKTVGQPPVTLRLWDAGVQLYALPLYATKDTLEKKPADGRRFPQGHLARLCLRSEGAREGGRHAREGVSQLQARRRARWHEGPARPSPSTPTPRPTAGVPSIPRCGRTRSRSYDELKQFTAGAPKLDDVITTAILDATKDVRPKIG